MAPSSIFSATPRPLRGQDRDVDRLGAGLDRDARRPSPPSARCRPGPRRRPAADAPPSPRRAAAPPPRGPARGRAGRPSAPSPAPGPCTVVAKFGAEQPSMPQPGLVGAAHLLEGGAHRPLHRVVDLDVLRRRRRAAGSASGSPRACPSSCCAAGTGASPAARSRCRSGVSSGTCGPQRRSASPSPRSASQRATRVTCIAAPWCEAQASASCSELRPSAAPLSTSGSACSILQDERGRMTASGSPQAARIAPRGVADHRMAAVVRLRDVAAPDLDHRHRVGHRHLPSPDHSRIPAAIESVGHAARCVRRSLKCRKGLDNPRARRARLACRIETKTSLTAAASSRRASRATVTSRRHCLMTFTPLEADRRSASRCWPRARRLAQSRRAGRGAHRLERLRRGRPQGVLHRLAADQPRPPGATARRSRCSAATSGCSSPSAPARTSRTR